MGDAARENNFDLIRALAALQVVAVHTVHCLGLRMPGWGDFVYDLIKAFPGVPVFFVVSGYLVTLSCQRNTLARYAANRALRIFPLLWASSLLLLLVLMAKGYGFPSIGTWFLGQVTVFQYYTPAELRSFGVGAPNGSLWTIPIEIQFYCVLPMVLALCRRAGLSALALLAALSGVAYWAVGAPDRSEPVLKALQYSIACYFPLFALGVAAALCRDKVERALSGRAHIFLALYLAWWAAARTVSGVGLMSPANPYAYLGAPLLAALVLSAAHTCRWLSGRILRGNDLSYGIYVFHMPVINLLLESGFKAAAYAPLVPLLASATLAMLSWRYLEKPALALRF